jgi:hypothetical protein
VSATREHTQTNQLNAWLEGVSEAFSLVSDFGPPTLAETPADLHARLLVTRSAMSRVSELAGEMTLLSARVKVALIERRGALDDAEAKSMSDVRPKRVALTEDFASAKERNARLMAGTTLDRASVRRVERLVAEVDAALVYTRDRHRELDRAVRDIDTRMRLMSYEPQYH